MNQAEEAYRQGNGKLRFGDHRAAVGYFDIAIRHDPSFARAWSNRGGAKIQLGDYRGAATDLDAALKLDPKDTVAWSNRALARDHLDDLPGAIQDYTSAIALEPNEGSFYLNRAAARERLGELERAVADATSALQRSRHPLIKSMALKVRGIAKRRQKDYSGALQDLTQATEGGGEGQQPYLERGIAKHYLRDFRGAVEDYVAALGATPTEAEAYLWKGAAEIELGARETALKDLAEGVDLYSGGHREALKRALKLYTEAGLEEAAEVFESAIAADRTLLPLAYLTTRGFSGH